MAGVAYQVLIDMVLAILAGGISRSIRAFNPLDRCQVLQLFNDSLANSMQLIETPSWSSGSRRERSVMLKSWSNGAIDTPRSIHQPVLSNTGPTTQPTARMA